MAIQKQTALSISKSGNVLTMTWKLADFYDSQETYWSIEGNKVLTTLDGDETTVSYTIPVANYFPATTKKLPSVTIAVRGIINGKYGAWVSAAYNFVTPKNPVVVKDGLKFKWSTDLAYVTGKKGGDPNVIDVEYQRVNSTTATQKNVKWGTDASSSDFSDVTGNNATGEVSFTETNKVEWFRCCARGLNGQSAWIYAYHVNAMPYTPTISKTAIKGTNVNLEWKVLTSVEHPIDYQYIQYCYATPTAEDAKGIPVCPSGVTWVTGANNILSTARKQAFAISQLPPADKCLFIRVCAVCESYTSTSDPVFAMGGQLVAPTLSSITTNAGITVVTFVDNSTCALSKVAIITSKNKVLATIPHGTSTATVRFTPNKDNLVGIVAFQGASATKPNMKSDSVFSTTGDVPLAPTNVAVVATDRTGVAEISWDMPWTDATGAEITWADHDDAWMSTKGPDTYAINQRATRWNVADLTSGVEYYFAVRLVDSAKVYSPYSQIVSLSYASAPGKPTLTSSSIAIQPGESFVLTWTYETTDTTEQALAVIYDNGVELARVENTAQRLSVTPAWLFGSSHSLTVQTTSRSGYVSVMSDPVVINVAERPTVSPISSAISSGITDGVLTDLPIVMEVTGAGDGGQTTIKIERLKDYFVERPDGSTTDGYGGETIFAISYSGEGEISIGANDLVGSFDDGGDYRLTAIVQDSVGQKAESYLDFIVGWDHQAEAPTATVTIDGYTAKVKAIAPASYESGDTVDIYRLSADKPELIVKGGEFGQFYVDPYPASNGGYRFVDITANGDYTNETGIAWIDKDCDFTLNEAVIDFNNQRISIPYNLDLDNSWEKDFTETQYLNGHVVGDWNAAISRSATINAVFLRDDERIATMRDLALWNGICHVRTPDGSSYSANVEVSESASYETKIVSYSLSIVRVDPESYEGIAEEV